MTKPWLPILLSLFLVGCSGISDTRPEMIRSSERMLERGVEAHALGDYTGAIDLFVSALAHYRSIDHRQGMLYGHLNLAETSLASGQLSHAATHIGQLESLAAELHDHETTQRATLLWARWYQQDGQTEQAIQILNMLLPTYRDGHPETAIGALQLAALTLRSELALLNDQDAGGWITRLEQGVAMQSKPDPWTTARLWRLQAQWLAHQGDIEKGLLLLDQALDTYRAAARRPAIAATLAEAAQLHWQAGQHELAADHYQRALLIRVWMMDRRHSRQLLEKLVSLYTEMDEHNKARESATLAEQITSEDAWQRLREAVRPR